MPSRCSCCEISTVTYDAKHFFAGYSVLCSSWEKTSSDPLCPIPPIVVVYYTLNQKLKTMNLILLPSVQCCPMRLSCKLVSLLGVAPNRFQLGSKLPQVGPKLAPSWLQVAPPLTEAGVSTRPEIQECAETLVVAPNWFQLGSKLPQVGSKLAPGWPQVGSKLAPSCPR